MIDTPATGADAPGNTTCEARAAAEAAGRVYDSCDVVEILETDGIVTMTNTRKKVINEVSLKIFADDQELFTLSCLDRQHKELALGLLYNEGVIESIRDIRSVEYNERLTSVMVTLREGLAPNRLEQLRRVASTCGKCDTFVNPPDRKAYPVPLSRKTHSAGSILRKMDEFVTRSELYTCVGGTHSVQFWSEDCQLLVDDIGRHNCLDKITGLLLMENKLELAADGVVFVSGRLPSEMLMKLVRLGIPVAVSKSSPTTAAVRLAREWGITILGYVKDGGGIIYSCPERITGNIGRSK